MKNVEEMKGVVRELLLSMADEIVDVSIDERSAIANRYERHF